MKTAALAMALLLGGAAFAQTHGTADPNAAAAASTAYDGDGAATTAYETDAAPSAATAMTAARDRLVQPGNSAPERDARGIAVISDPAVAPAGWNGSPATAMGGPLLDPVTGEAAAPEHYPACTATVTDNCLQTYERGRRAG